MNGTLKLSVLGVAMGAVTLAAVITSAAGPNLVQNGDFSQGAAGWTPSPGLEQATELDPVNGALAVTNIAPGAGNYNISVTQCMEIDDLHEIHFGGSVYIPEGQVRTGGGTIWAWPFPQANCGGSSDYARGEPEIKTPGQWDDQQSSFIPPDGTQSVRIELRNHRDDDPVEGDFIVWYDNVFLWQGDQVNFPTPTPEPPSATIEICKHIFDNGDAHADGATFTFKIGAGTIADPPFITDFPVTASESADGCATIDLSVYGVPPSGGELLWVVENPLAGWTNQAGYPTFSANGGPTHVGTYAGLANLGASFIHYSNKRVVDEGVNDPPPAEPRNIMVCSVIDENGDGDTESMSWDYAVYVQGQQAPFAVVPLNIVEGPQGWDCDAVDLAAAGVAGETAFTVIQVVDPLWNDAPFYPGFSAGGAPGSGNSASFTYALGSEPYFNVTFQNKEAIVAPPAPPADDPTPPADDPTPPAEDPTPPADDPTPPADDPTPPTEDPTPPADDPNPPAPVDEQDDSGSSGDGPAAGSSEGEPGPVAGAGPESGGSAPLPPSTGSGTSAETNRNGAMILLGGALAALGAAPLARCWGSARRR